MEVKTKVLIVDDDERNCRILQEILGGEFDLETAINGTEALRCVASFSPDIILLDIMMPDMDGLEVTRQIRNDDRHKNIKIILVSGKARLEERLEGYEAGADDYVTKPFDDDEFLAKVRIFSSLRKAEEIDQLKTNFLNLLSHETGTPVNTINTLSSMLLNQSSLSDADRKSVALINKSGELLADKIDRILLLSSLKADGLCKKRQSVNTNDLVNEVIDMVAHLAQDNNIKIRTEFSATKDIAACYESLERAIYFIVENAVQYSPENGEVVIATSLSDDGKAFIIQVSDSGPGLEEDMLSVPFSEFGIQDILHHDAGLGISLAISNLVITLHMGDINVENREDSGAVFTVKLPLEEEA